jgi:hypothetical protein
MSEPQIIEAPATVLVPNGAPAASLIAGPTDLALMPTTTKQQQLIKESQIGIDRLWERTQTTIAILMAVTLAMVCVILVLKDKIEIAVALLGPLAALIFNSYFTRTNHVKTGGVSEDQQGR